MNGRDDRPLRTRLLATFGDEHCRQPSFSDAGPAPFPAETPAPLAELLPGTPDDVAAMVRHCLAEGIAMIPRGGGTGLAGGAVPVAGDDRPTVVIALERLDRVRALDAVNRTVAVDAGCPIDAVDRAVAEAGLTFPLRIGSGGTAEIGGAIATSAGGIRSWRYGTMRALTIGVEAVLANGDVWSGLRTVAKATAGIDVGQLLIGSEGTLGIVTGAVLRLAPRPSAHVAAFLAVDDPGAAIALFREFEAAGGLEVFELLSATGLRHYAAAHPDRALPASLDYPWHVLVEWAGDNSGALAARVEALLVDAAATRIVDGALARNERERAAFWHIREVHGAACRRAGTPVQHDIAVPVSALPAFMGEAGAIVRAAIADARIVPVCHVGDGNVHFDILRPFDADAGWDARMAEAGHAIHDLAVRLGGTFSAEHGIGATKREELRRLTAPESYAAMKAVKAALDPKGLMNPGKVLI